MNNGAISSMLSGVQSEMSGSIGEALPIAGVVFGAIAGIGIAVKLFKRLTGARA